MFKNTFQSGFLSILYSIGSKPLQIWDKKVGRCEEFDEIQANRGFVIEGPHKYQFFSLSDS